eukprot:9395521-Ditylum_brightwellii.AAC.1
MGGTVGTEARSSSRRRGKIAIAFPSAFYRRYAWCWVWSHAVILANSASWFRGFASPVGGTLALAVHNAIARKKAKEAPRIDPYVSSRRPSKSHR